VRPGAGWAVARPSPPVVGRSPEGCAAVVDGAAATEVVVDGAAASVVVADVDGGLRTGCAAAGGAARTWG